MKIDHEWIRQSMRCVLEEEMADLPVVKQIIFIADTGEDVLLSSSTNSDKQIVRLLEKARKQMENNKKEELQ